MASGPALDTILGSLEGRTLSDLLGPSLAETPPVISVDTPSHPVTSISNGSNGHHSNHASKKGSNELPDLSRTSFNDLLTGTFRENPGIQQIPEPPPRQTPMKSDPYDPPLPENDRFSRTSYERYPQRVIQTPEAPEREAIKKTAPEYRPFEKEFASKPLPIVPAPIAPPNLTSVAIRNNENLWREVDPPITPVRPSSPPRHRSLPGVRNIFDAIQKYGDDTGFIPRQDDPELVPTNAVPGSVEKIEILRHRLEQGLPLHHENDRKNYSGLMGIRDFDDD